MRLNTSDLDRSNHISGYNPVSRTGMKIAYVTTFDSLDIHAWSGLPTNILKAFQNCGFQTEIIGNLRDKYPFLWKIKKALYAKILFKTYFKDREPTLLKHYATQVETALATMHCDVVFSPGTIPIAYLRTEKPIVIWADATFAGMIDFYPDFSNLCAETIKNGNKMEQLALSKCRIAIYTSEWAANTAIQNYDVDPAKVKVVPFGANISCNRNLQDIKTIIDTKNFDTCKLLFVGVDWFRKGGDIALLVADQLNQRGIKTELHIVGCTPPVRLPSFVKQHGFISKNTEEGRMYLDKLMTESHFLILPSRAECYGVVFAEASSFGLPSLATEVGGIPTAIQDGKNGYTFPLDESPEKYCDSIERLMSSKREYNDLALSSFREYSERLNWSSAGGKVHDLIQKFCG
jgi:glycosyltransferase involved in cell wall biosynthesis